MFDLLLCQRRHVSIIDCHQNITNPTITHQFTYSSSDTRCTRLMRRLSQYVRPHVSRSDNAASVVITNYDVSKVSRTNVSQTLLL